MTYPSAQVVHFPVVSEQIVQCSPHAVQELLSKYLPNTHEVQVVATVEQVLQLVSQGAQSVPK
jgi:flagellar biosynthesis/type III secretory pathway protein FliH